MRSTIEEETRRKKLVPKGTSSYQAAWIIDSEEEDEGEEEDEDEESDMVNSLFHS